MAQRCIRFSDSIEAEVEDAVRKEGYASAADFVRTAVEHELKQRQAFLQSEREIAATLEQHRAEIRNRSWSRFARFSRDATSNGTASMRFATHSALT